MGPTDTNYYWQLADSSLTDPSRTAQYGASEFGVPSMAATESAVTLPLSLE